MKKAKILSLAGILSLATAMPSAQALEDGQKFNDWAGNCVTENSNKFCNIEQRVFDKQKQLVLVAQFTKLDKPQVLVGKITVPLGVALQYGVALSIDGKELGRIPYEVCFNNSCSATFPVDKELSAKLKKGSQLNVTVMGGNNKVSYPISLSGITKALEAL